MTAAQAGSAVSTTASTVLPLFGALNDESAAGQATLADRL
jgi:hypothetical protein